MIFIVGGFWFGSDVGNARSHLQLADQIILPSYPFMARNSKSSGTFPRGYTICSVQPG